MAKTSHPQASCSSSWAFCCSSGTVPSTREHCWTAKAYLTLSLQSPGSNIAVSLQKAPRAALERATTPSAPSDNLHASAFRVRGTAQVSSKDGLFMTAHKAAASLLSAGPNMHPVGMNPAVNTLQDPIQRNTVTLTHAFPILTDRCEFSVLGNSNACGDITATDGGLEAIIGFSSRMGTFARHFAMGIMHNSLRIQHSVSKRPASFLRDSSHDREFKRNHSAATRGVISAEERGYRRRTPLSYEVRFLQPIFCCAQKRWRLTTNIGFTPFESCTQNEQIQDVDSKNYSVLDSTKRWSRSI